MEVSPGDAVIHVMQRLKLITLISLEGEILLVSLHSKGSCCNLIVNTHIKFNNLYRGID